MEFIANLFYYCHLSKPIIINFILLETYPPHLLQSPVLVKLWCIWQQNWHQESCEVQNTCEGLGSVLNKQCSFFHITQQEPESMVSEESKVWMGRTWVWVPVRIVSVRNSWFTWGIQLVRDSILLIKWYKYYLLYHAVKILWE